MKILTVVGARPQFIKTAVISKELRKQNREILVHTGQHYDASMSDIFFEELEIPRPDYNLGINGGSHAKMTARMMIGIEKILEVEQPDAVLVYGDTNSTLAAALTTAKLHIPLVHVEAGARTYSMSNPEEINRLCTDHISTILLASTERSLHNLEVEGLGKRSQFVGDAMYDAFLQYKDRAQLTTPRLKLINESMLEVPQTYYLLTCHREENTVKEGALEDILEGMNTLEYPTIYPVHPRIREHAREICNRRGYSNVKLVEPVGYLESLYLTMNAKKVVTDSGGLQREAFFAEVQCITMLDFEVWPETMIDNRNQLCRASKNELLKKLDSNQRVNRDYKPFGDGRASERIADVFKNL